MPPIPHQDLLNIKEKAKIIAQKYNHIFVNPEHILLAMINENCKASAFLNSHFSLSNTKKELNKYLKSFTNKDSDSTDKDIEKEEVLMFSLRAMRIVNAANDLASSFKNKVDSRHMLWGLLQEHHSFAFEALLRTRVTNKKENSSEDNKINSDDRERMCRNWANELENQLVSSESKRPALMSLNSEKHKNDSEYWRKQLANASEMLLKNQVIQKTAVQRVVNTLTRSWADVMGTDRPLASFLFVGPRGSGKRSLARNMASFLYNSPKRLNTISLGDYSEEVRSLNQLKGEPVENDDSQEDVLTRLATEYPNSLIYLEDVERANSKTMDTIHQLLKHGHILDAHGKVVNFRGNVIVLSLGIDPMYFEREKQLGLRGNIPGPNATQEQYERILMEDLERVLRADTLGMVDEVVFFPPLTDDELVERAKVMFRDLRKNVQRQYNIDLSIDDSVYDYLMKRLRDLGKDTGTLHRSFTREVSNAVAQGLLHKKLKNGSKALLKGPNNGEKNIEGQAITVEIIK